MTAELQVTLGCSAEVSLLPAAARLRAYAGDPIEFGIHVRDADGNEIDTTGWDWRGTLTTGRERIDFQITPRPDGVRIRMAGDGTARLPHGKEFPYDVTTRPPGDAEGRTVLRGQMVSMARVTEPLRAEPPSPLVTT
jgi:hypothetical protein